MGGDYAPAAPVAGALIALTELGAAHSFQLVGRAGMVQNTLDTLLAGDYASAREHCGRLSIVDAPDFIEMSDKPVSALRAKPYNSMNVGLGLQVKGESDAFVSAGNTGAQMAASALVLKLHPGLTRPAIATIFPTSQRPVIVLDSGANVDCSARELLQFALLGGVYAQCILGRVNPAIGLLSVGEESEKGNAVVKEANSLLRAAGGLNFYGNVEGRDLPAGGTDRGPLDVVVCDGFVGNVLLKFYEAVTPMIVGLIERSGGMDAAGISRALGELDYTKYGGAPLLGVRGVSIIAHGKSSPNAIKNALNVAAQAVDSRMNGLMGERLSAAARESEAA